MRRIKRYLAIRSYMYRLTQELVRRFGKRTYYSIDQVTQAIKRGKLSVGFIAYAHAAFCNEEDFNAYYTPLEVVCTYEGLRRVVARRYLSGQIDFDAKTIIIRYYLGKLSSEEFSESGTGMVDLGGDR